jgi:MFS family permease
MLDKVRPPLATRLPFFYGWVIVAVAFVTVAMGVTARTSFSLLFPPIVDEFGWDRGLAAGAFSFGFFVSALITPVIGRVMDTSGPRTVILAGVLLTAAGLIGATWMREPWHLYLTLGLFAGAGVNCMGFTAQSQYLPNWFVRRRAFAIAVAFSGAGIGAILILPLLQVIIARDGWRASCWSLGVATLLILLPLNLLVFKRPQDLGLAPDGDGSGGRPAPRRSYVVDAAWAAIDWTPSRALATARFWWVIVGYFAAGFAWYAVQVHQTKYLIEVGFSATEAAWALGLVAMVAVPAQIALGALSDRVGREIVWTISCAGFAVCYGALLALEAGRSEPLLYLMVLSQGLLGYALTGIMGPIVAELFEGRHYGTILGFASGSLIVGGAAGPLVAGLVHDLTGSYRIAFLIAIALCFVSSVAIWLAAPRRVRMVPGRMREHA